MKPSRRDQFRLLLAGRSIFCITIFLITGISVGKICGNCGPIPVPYPLSTSPGCGDPNYPVFCNTTGGVLYLKPLNGSYPISSIDPQSQRFVIKPASFIENTCRTSDIGYNGIHLNKDWAFNFTTANTVFLLNCSPHILETQLNCSSSSLCWSYMKQASTEGCQSSKICCTIYVGGSISSYNVIVNESRCTGYKSYMNLNPNSPLADWKEGLQVQWRMPPEFACQNQTDCLDAIPNSTCRNDPGNNGTMRCYCDGNLQWNPSTGSCIRVPCVGLRTCQKGKCIALISGLTCAVFLVTMLIGLSVHKKHRLAKEARVRLRKRREEILSANCGGRSAKLFSGKDMKKATNSFSQELLLGSGGFGEVYKGTLEDGTPIAVKIGKVDSTKGTDQVLNEVGVLSQVNHRSLVRLLGCCIELEQPMLVYEFVPNGTLYEHIFTNRYGFLKWHERLGIAYQTAEGLAYLHSSAVPPIYHRDVKSSNILLGEKCNAKVSDFGLSRPVEQDASHVSTCVQGTIGYLDPEYYRNYQLTDKSDVYSFGVVLLEILTSKKVIDFSRGENEANLVVYVQHRVDEGKTVDVIDERLLMGASSVSLQSMKALCSLAMGCLEGRRQDRPSMKEVAEDLDYILCTEQATSIFSSKGT